MTSNHTNISFLLPHGNQTTLASYAKMSIFDAKSSFICVVIVLNFVFNGLVISLMYKYRRTMFKDKTMIFMLSLSISDLLSGILFMPLSALACSNFHPTFRKTFGLWPTVNMMGCWWFGYNSLHSLAWVSISKTIAVICPLRFDAMLTKKRCIYICMAIWMSGLALSSSRLYIKGKQKLYTWNDKICLFRTPKTHHLGVNYWRLFSLVATDVLPIIAMIISTGLIITVIVRIHYKIQVQKSCMKKQTTITKGHCLTHVAIKTIRSSRNILIIVIISFLMQVPIVTYISAKHMAGYKGKMPINLIFIAFWSFHSSGMVNSFLFLILYSTVRHQVACMLSPLLSCSCLISRRNNYDGDSTNGKSKFTKSSSITASSVKNDSVSNIIVSLCSSRDKLAIEGEHCVPNPEVEVNRVHISQDIAGAYSNYGFEQDVVNSCDEIDIVASVYDIDQSVQPTRKADDYNQQDRVVSFSLPL